MKALVILTIAMALLLAGGEAARWWGQARFIPLALDELLVAALMIGSAAAARRFGTVPLAAAWGVFCGLILGLLVPILDHLLHGPAKEGAGFYALILAAMLCVGAGSTAGALSLSRPRRKDIAGGAGPLH